MKSKPNSFKLGLKWFKMQYDLLIHIFDKQTDLFVSGIIEYDMFLEIETEYLKRKQLFTICLN